MATTIIKRPVITEKSLKLANESNIYTFEVMATARKNQVKDAIEMLFGVNVVSVNTIKKYRVKKRTGKKRMPTLLASTKKALLTLKEGQTIELFDLSK